MSESNQVADEILDGLVDYASLLERVDEANRMRGEALKELAVVQQQRDTAESYIAREYRISDSEMMQLLRRVNKRFETRVAELEKEISEWQYLAEAGVKAQVELQSRVVKLEQELAKHRDHLAMRISLNEKGA